MASISLFASMLLTTGSLSPSFSSTFAYNVHQAVRALWAGIDADSMALVGFGLDSILETAAAGAGLCGTEVPASPSR